MNSKTAASLKTEIGPQAKEKRSTRVSSIRRSQRISSNTIVGQTRCHGDIEQRKESPGFHGNRRRKRSHGEESAERKNEADLRKHLCLQRHKRFVKVLHCRVCQREYESHQDLLKHVCEEHIVRNPSTIENGDDQIETHRLNEKLHICVICGLKLTRPSHLLNHLWLHIVGKKNRSRNEQQSKFKGQQNRDCDGEEDVEKAGSGDGRFLPSKDAFVTETIRSVTDDFHTDAGEISTDICSKDIRPVNSSDQPEVRRINLKPFKCRMCANAFASQDDLEKHEVVHSEKKPVSKPLQRRKTFSTAQTLRNHSKRRVNSKKSARRKSLSDKCEESNSMLNSKMILKCCECDTSFKSNVGFMRHVVLHNLRGLQHVCRATDDGDCAFLRFKDDVKKFRAYVCEFCQKAFLTPSQLRLHVMVHTGEKCHHCSLCEAGFVDVGNLKKHMLTHTGEKPFCCNICGMRFSQNSNLKVHLTRHTSEKPFKCSDCSKEFHQLSQLRSHQELYQEDKYMYRVHQQRIINARKMHELGEKAAEEGDEKELLNRTDGDGQTIVEQYDYDTDEEQE